MPVLLGFIARLPLPLLHGLGSVLGLLALLRGSHRRLLVDNLRHAGFYSPAMLLKVGMNLGKMLLELPAMWLRPFGAVTAMVREVNGWEHVEAALGQGKGVIFIGPHLGSWELAGLYISSRTPLHALYRRPRQAWFHELMEHGRHQGGVHTVEPNLAGVRTLFKALKRNTSVFILPDQHASEGDGLWTPFLGRWAYMPTLTYRLYAKTAAPMILYHCERLPFGRGYRLNLSPVPALPEDAEAASRIVNRIMEEHIRRQPEQYLWSYRLHGRGKLVPPEGPAR